MFNFAGICTPSKNEAHTLQGGQFSAVAGGSDLYRCRHRADRGEGEQEAVTLLAGYDAVEDVRDAGTQPAALLAAATLRVDQ